MKHLFIIGARGWGREAYAAFKTSKEVLAGEMDIIGFLDSNFDALKGLHGSYPPIIGMVETYEVQEDDIFFIAQGDPHWRKHYAEIIEAKGGSFYTYISEKAFVNDTAQIGEGSFIDSWCSISDNVTLGKHVLIHPYTSIGHDSIIKDYGTLLTGVFLGGGAQIGKCSQICPKSIVIPHKKVGDNVMVGVGSVVMRNIEDGICVFGNPAKKLKI